MDTSEAVSTILGLWPNSFRPADKWRGELISELQDWSDNERSTAVDMLKTTHSARRVTIELLRKAKPASTQMIAPVSEDSPNTHERRLKPTDSMKGFQFRRSMLRLNPTWSHFLDTIHPTAEHCYFSHLVNGEFAHELKNASAHGQDYIRTNYGEKLAELFKRPIAFVGKPREV